MACDAQSIYYLSLYRKTCQALVREGTEGRWALVPLIWAGGNSVFMFSATGFKLPDRVFNCLKEEQYICRKSPKNFI